MDELTREQDQRAEALASEYRSVEEVCRVPEAEHLLVVRAHENFDTGRTHEFVIDPEGVIRARMQVS